ncbi:MAG: hypothetical protein Kilf2KO_45640 [Rhodospirillales bacterium]
MSDDKALPLDWSSSAIIERRDRYYAASQRKFVPYQEPLIVACGKGQYLWDNEGTKLIDLLAMNLCISVGHAHPRVNAAAQAQAEALPHCTTMFHHPVPAHFAEELTATFPAGEDWVCHFTNSGGEAIDLALTMARAFTGNIDMLSLRGSYHGPTIGAQSLTGIAGFRHKAPLLTGIQFIAEPNPYRGVFGDRLQPYLDEVEHAIALATSGHLAGIIMEPVQGYCGIVPLIEGYMSGAAERVRAAGGLCIVDEVQTGFGRTGSHFWAFEREGLIPDIVVLAKGIGNGYPLAAVVAKREIAEALADKFLFHTYGSNPMSCAAGRAVLQVIAEENLQANAAEVGATLLAGLHDLQQRHAVIGDVRGRGLMLAVELVEDRASKTPATAATAQVFEAARREGLVLSKSGPDRSVLRMVPPLCLSQDDTQEVLEKLDRAFSCLN